MRRLKLTLFLAPLRDTAAFIANACSRGTSAPVYTERYNWVGGFSEGLATAEQDGKVFHIKPDGTRIP